MIENRLAKITSGLWVWLCLTIGGAGIATAQPAVGETVRPIQVKHLADIRQDFNQPTEVAVGPDSRLYVLDGANHQVKMFDAKWRYIGAIGRQGREAGQFHSPVGIDIDEAGRIYVADTGNQRIQIFGRTGKFQRQIDLKPWQSRPVEVEARQGGKRIYVSDARNHQVMVFAADGSLTARWGRMGNQKGQLRFPGMMAARDGDDLYVVDILNGRVQVFDAGGGNPRQISQLGVLPGQLYRPKGIALDGDGGVYISDSYTGVIQVFEPTGRFRGILASPDGPGHLRLVTPLGIAIDSDKRLYVVQSTLNMVSVYALQ